MNFNIFVLIVTLVFYIVFKIYRTQVENENNTNTKKKSFLIYVLLIPAVLYLTKYMYINENIVNFSKVGGGMEIGESVGRSVGRGSIDNISFEAILTSPYPESSILVSSSN